MKKRVLGFISLGSIAVLTSSFSYACSCMHIESPQKGLETSNNVFVGKVKNIEIFSETNPFPTTKKRVTFDVNKIFKGSAATQKQIQTNQDSASCGYNFEQGKEYIVYTYKTNKGLDEVSLCSRTAFAKNNDDIIILGKKTYSTKEAFEKFEGKSCKSATDGCNTFFITKDGKVGGGTLMYCEDVDGKNGQEKWSCLKHKNPTICTKEYDPVCGVDGNTYSNYCVAGNKKIAYKGECIKENGLVESLDNELIKLEKKLGEKAQKINKNIEKYRKELQTFSEQKRILLNEKVIKKLQSIEDKLFEGQPLGTPLPEKITKKFNLYRYLELKLQIIQHSFGVKISETVQYCDELNGTINQCKRE